MDILLRIRTSRIALTADIERAFLQIRVNKRDQDVLRFLWFDDVAKSQPEVHACHVWSVVKSLPVECHDQAPPGEVHGDTP